MKPSELARGYDDSLQTHGLHHESTVTEKKQSIEKFHKEKNKHSANNGQYLKTQPHQGRANRKTKQKSGESTKASGKGGIGSSSSSAKAQSGKHNSKIKRTTSKFVPVLDPATGRTFFHNEGTNVIPACLCICLSVCLSVCLVAWLGCALCFVCLSV